MESLIQCDGGCQSLFNAGTNIPKILPKCGHTLCLKCIKQLQTKGGNPQQVQCSLCGNRSTIEGGNPDSLITNDKVLKIVETIQKSQEAMDY
jgi:hypothetical protein